VTVVSVFHADLRVCRANSPKRRVSRTSSG